MFTCTMIAPGIAYGPAVIWVTAGEFFHRQQISPPSVPAEIQRFDVARSPRGASSMRSPPRGGHHWKLGRRDLHGAWAIAGRPEILRAGRATD